MEVFSIPVKDRFILYRPLLQLAFVGNQAMADLVLDFAAYKSPLALTSCLLLYLNHRIHRLLRDKSEI